MKIVEFSWGGAGVPPELTPSSFIHAECEIRELKHRAGFWNGKGTCTPMSGLCWWALQNLVPPLLPSPSLLLLWPHLPPLSLYSFHCNHSDLCSPCWAQECSQVLASGLLHSPSLCLWCSSPDRCMTLFHFFQILAQMLPWRWVFLPALMKMATLSSLYNLFHGTYLTIYIGSGTNNTPVLWAGNLY